jgi:hypothetical protein
MGPLTLRITATRLCLAVIFAGGAALGVAQTDAPVNRSLPEPTPLVQLEPREQCDRCYGTLLSGSIVPHPETKWGIISDLPESFDQFGVLYSTRAVLPENGGAPEMLRQISTPVFATIDASFDVFFFHLNKNREQASRIVVLVRNKGQNQVEVVPYQVIKTEGIIGTVHDFENTLTRRVMARRWDQTAPSAEGSYPEITFGDEPPPGQQPAPIAIPPGQARVVAYSRQFGNVSNGPDSSRNVNCFGYGRFIVQSSARPSLEVSVIAIPAGPRNEISSQALAWEDKGARTTDEVPMNRAPQNCALGRAVGVYQNFAWVAKPMVLDVTKLDEAGTSFPFALPKVQSMGCPEARQTADLVLRPGYTREDTIGNYMIENEARWTLVNPVESTETVTVELRLGGPLADIGLAYAIAITDMDFTGNPFENTTVQTLWAGPKQTARAKAMMPEPLKLAPGEARTVHLRWMVVPNSSLPYMMGWHRGGRVDGGR